MSRHPSIKKCILAAVDKLEELALNGKTKPQGICQNLRVLLANFKAMDRLEADTDKIWATYPDYSGDANYPIKDPNGGTPKDYYLGSTYTRSRWKGKQLEQRLELLQVIRQFYS